MPLKSLREVFKNSSKDSLRRSVHIGVEFKNGEKFCPLIAQALIFALVLTFQGWAVA